MCCWSPGTSSSGTIALTGHSGMQTAQSMHSSGSMVRKFGPSRKQSTGQTSTQSVYLQRMHDSSDDVGHGGGSWRLRRLGGAPRQRDGIANFKARAVGHRRRAGARRRVARCSAARSARAPAPTVTTVGRPACSTLASRQRGDACGRWRAGRASRRARPRSTGVSAGQPASTQPARRARRAGGRPCRRPRCRRCARPAARRSRVIAVVRLTLRPLPRRVSGRCVAAAAAMRGGDARARPRSRCRRRPAPAALLRGGRRRSGRRP